MIDFEAARDWFSLEEEEPVLEEPAFDEEESAPFQAPLVTVMSASGATGKSTIALIASMLSSDSGLNTALLEGDLQFGDLGFWLKLDESAPTLSDRPRQPVSISHGVALYRAPLFPEIAERISDDIMAELPRLRANHDLVIADTGAFWSGLTAELLLQSDLFLLIVDSRPASIAAAVKATELCARLGIPLARMVVVYNRYSTKAPLNEDEVACALGVDEVSCVGDARAEVEALLSVGAADELIESDDALVRGVRNLLTTILPRVGRLYADAPLRRRGGLFR